MSTLAYEIVDVFTDRPFAGNPLAVVLGGAALTIVTGQSPADSHRPDKPSPTHQLTLLSDQAA